MSCTPGHGPIQSEPNTLDHAAQVRLCSASEILFWDLPYLLRFCQVLRRTGPSVAPE